MTGERCAGCGLPIGNQPSMKLADDAVVRFTDYECLIRYGKLREAAGLTTSRKRSSTDITLTEEQREAVAAIERAIERRETFALHGRAGTGKTTVAAYIARSRPGAHLCAPTAKATSVLAAKTGIDASTVHSTFYHFVERENEKKLVFRPKHEPGSLKGDVVLLDESSMVSRDVAADILATGITVVAIGDPAQLPPINGTPFFTTASFTLTEIDRQALESPIIRQAHAVLAGGSYAPDGVGVRVISRLSAADLRAADIVLTGRRATRMRMNAEIRRARGITAPLPRLGEPLVCLRNARKYGLCNGDHASRDLQEGDETVGITTDDGDDIEVHAAFVAPGHGDLPPGGWKPAFAFGYALTVHMAQGSEFDHALLIDEWFGDGRIPWLCTGMTRAAQRLTIARRELDPARPAPVPNQRDRPAAAQLRRPQAGAAIPARDSGGQDRGFRRDNPQRAGTRSSGLGGRAPARAAAAGERQARLGQRAARHRRRGLCAGTGIAGAGVQRADRGAPPQQARRIRFHHC